MTSVEMLWIPQTKPGRPKLRPRRIDLIGLGATSERFNDFSEGKHSEYRASYLAGQLIVNRLTYSNEENESPKQVPVKTLELGEGPQEWSIPVMNAMYVYGELTVRFTEERLAPEQLSPQR